MQMEGNKLMNLHPLVTPILYPCSLILLQAPRYMIDSYYVFALMASDST